MTDAFIGKIKSTVHKYNMIQKHDRILVGLSGGPDSVVLLYVLSNIFKKEYGLDVYIGHLDHRFRGRESADDRKFCEELAREMGIDIVCEEIDVPKISEEKKISPEEAARQERYDFFRKVCELKRIKKIAVGHTRDDQAETVLMRLIRGAGMLGLGGIHPIKDIQGITVIRPLIEISRQEIEDFIESTGLRYRCDSSNDKLIFARNRVRHELLPYMEKNFNPNIKEVLANMAENLRVENDFLEKFAKRKFRGISKNRHREIVIDIKKFKKQPEAMKKRILRNALEFIKGDLRRFTYQHWKEMDELIANRPFNSIVNLPGNIEVIKNRNSLVLKIDLQKT